MPLPPRTRVGPYEVIASIGAGGMGEVYRAHDARLNRDVAVKILPGALSTDPERRKRFDREARTIAALSHPCICAIHDIGRQDDLDYLVLELVDGESLAARLKRGPLSLEELIAYARDIANALTHAHDKGVVHRDLKPGNVMVTTAGAKVLDFGLAAVMRRDDGAGLGAEVTATAPLTAAGTVLGTVAYMAPEQIEGRPVDTRSDIFAFGAMLYEMATGKRAFDAPSTPALIGAILRDQPPPLDELRPGLPPALDRLIRACLEKRPGDRLASMHDVAIALGWIDASRRDPVAASVVAPPRAGMSRRTVIGAGGLAVAAGALGYVLGRARAAVAPPATFVYDIALPDGTTPGAGLALSRDGRWLAVSTGSGVGTGFGLQLWIRNLARDAWLPIEVPHERGQGAYPFWSPDGRQVAFLLKGRLVRVTIPDGAPLDICALQPTSDGFFEYRGGVWLDDDTIVFGTGTAGLMIVPATGGDAREIVGKQQVEIGLKHPVLVEGRTIVYLAQSHTQSEIRLVTLDAPANSRLVVASSDSPAYDAGTIFYLRQGVLVGQPCDRAGQLSGDVQRVAVDTTARSMNNGFGQICAGGGNVAVLNARPAVRQAYWYGRDGSRQPFGEPSDQIAPAVSPDGRRIAISRRTPRESFNSVWVINFEGAVARRLTGDFDDQLPVWSADSRHLMFRSRRGIAGNGNLFSVNVEGPPVITTLAERLGSMYPAGWLAGGDAFVWSTDSSVLPNESGLYLSRPGSDKDELLRAAPRVNDAVLSPDGRFVAYSSDESGRHEVYLDTVPRPLGRPIQLSQGGGQNPAWRADSAELYFARGTALMAVSIAGRDPLRAGATIKLFDAPTMIDRRTFAPAADGSRFILLHTVFEAEHSVKVTLNWGGHRR